MAQEPGQPKATSTSLSLLAGAQSGDQAAWEVLVNIYGPWIRNILIRLGAQPNDADEIAQATMCTAYTSLAQFVHNGATGAFRGWLRRVTHTELALFHRRNKIEAAGGSDNLAVVDQIEDSANDLNDIWEREHDSAVIDALIRHAEREFSSTQVKVFRLRARGVPSQVAADQLGVSPASVYVAYSVVLRYLRERAADLLTEFTDPS